MRLPSRVPGFHRKFQLSRKSRLSVTRRSCGEDFELLGNGGRRIGGKPRLSFAHHMNHLDARQDNFGSYRWLEAEYGPEAAVDAPMILFDAIVEIPALVDSDRLQSSPGSIPRAIFKIARSDGLVVGLAAVDDNTLRPAMALQGFRKKRLADST